MKAFIEYLGDIILDKIKKGDEPILILPNKRPIAYLQKYMAATCKKPIWFPQIYTIEDFVLKITHRQLADPLYTASCLYEIYTDVLQDQADSFDDFLKWWSLIIADFNDIDMYMVDSRQLFNYITEAKAIENWNPGQQEPTQLQQHYLTFWKYLPLFYAGLNQKLNEEHLGYRGMIYRKAAAILQEQGSPSFAQDVIFAGFNALSTSEEVIIEHFLSSKKGAIYWEADDYYVKDEKQEAGKFLRNYNSKWQHYTNAIFFSNNSLLNEAKEVHMIGAPKSMMQATIAGQKVAAVLQHNSNPQEPVNAALIPADESLLQPLLYQLPANQNKQLNISMGYPLMWLPLNSLYEVIFDILNQLEKDKQAVFNTNILHQLFSHPYASILVNNTAGQTSINDLKKLKQKLLSSGKINYSLAELNELQQPETHINFYWIFEDLVNCFTHMASIVTYLQKLNEHLAAAIHAFDTHKELVLMQVDVYQQLLSELSQVYLTSEKIVIKQSKTLISLINQSLTGKSLPFIGNATGGFQFIGLLETRMLQFDEIIITGCNESILPNAKASGNSFIPFDIRHQFNLPTYKDSEAVFAYHFYRLIQGAKKIHLIYNTETDEFGSGEKSRFLTQLEMELPLKNNKAKIFNDIVKLPVAGNFKRSAIAFDHNESIDKTLQLICEKGLSATALISYKNCPLQFYFKYIERIQEPDEIATEVGANIVGSVIHAVLEEIYAPLKNQFIQFDQINYSFESLERMTKKAFSVIESGADSSTGKNLLFVQTATRIVSKFLQQEQKAIQNGVKLRILHTEEQFECHLPIAKQAVKLRGTIDRLDEWNNTTRIIDYKTGSVDASKLKLKSMDDIFENPDYDKAFQLLFYSLLYHKNYPDKGNEVEAGILSLRKISDGLYTVSSEEEPSVIMTNFEENLTTLIQQLLDPKKAFVQTLNAETCNYCAFQNICMK